MRLILFFFLTPLYLMDGEQSGCSTPSRKCPQIPNTNPAIYQCKSEENLQRDESVCQTDDETICFQDDDFPTIYRRCNNDENGQKTFSEGANITLASSGKTEKGCSFKVTQKDQITCCYIEERREKNRKDLCGMTEQPKECRQRGTGEHGFEVKEFSEGVPLGVCKLSMFGARTSDSGVYTATFRFGGDKKKNQKIIVEGIQVEVKCFLLNHLREHF